MHVHVPIMLVYVPIMHVHVPIMHVHVPIMHVHVPIMHVHVPVTFHVLNGLQYTMYLQIDAVMQPYITMNGYYLVRPSASSEGQLTLAVR